MRCRNLIIAFVCFWLSISPPNLQADVPLPEPIHTAELQFDIPFQLAPGEVEVRLYISDDLGASWKLNAAAKPPMESFSFQAGGEREFWFALRSLDAAGNETPVGPMRPEMRVIVDTAKPKIDVRAEPTPTGSILLKWRADDAHLSPDSLKLTWKQAIGDPKPHEIPSLRTKRRLDAAGASGELEWRPEMPLDNVLVRAEIADAAGNIEAFEVALGQPANRVNDGIESHTTGSAFAPSADWRQTPSAASTVAVTPAIRDPSQPLWVNSTSFELDYDLDPLAEPSVTKVEVWGTRDDGRSWILLGLDEDRRSPCSVSVDKEGSFGFTIAIHAPTLGPSRTPRAGDAPEIRVGVDLSKPRVRLTTAEPPADGRPCSLQINWEAADDHLGPQAVTLSYAGSPQGPWRPMAVGVPNDGRRVCDFDPAGPDVAYLKIDVRDEAGNTASHATIIGIPIEKRPVKMTFAGAARPEGAGSGPKWFHVLQ